MDLSNLFRLFFRWLPGFLITLVLLGIGIFVIRQVYPAWQDYQAASGEVGTMQAAVNTQIAAQDGSDNQVILQHQIDAAQGQLQQVGTYFLTDAEAQQVLNRLYQYAYSRGVRVVALQAQQAATATSPAPYSSTVFQVQVSGGVANLIDFISHFHEASLPSVNIISMSVSQQTDQALLTMVLQIYTSPYASGDALSQFPTTAPTPSPTPTLDPPTATPPPLPSATPTIAATTAFTATPTDPPTATMTPTQTQSPTPTFTFTATHQPSPTATGTVVVCAGAQTLFKVGDIAIVHFSGIGALRVLSDPNGSIMSTRTQAYDKQHLQIIAGPVCANGSFYWYIRNQSHNNDLGWVAEGQGQERWLCPETNPTCSS